MNEIISVLEIWDEIEIRIKIFENLSHIITILFSILISSQISIKFIISFLILIQFFNHYTTFYIFNTTIHNYYIIIT